MRPASFSGSSTWTGMPRAAAMVPALSPGAELHAAQRVHDVPALVMLRARLPRFGRERPTLGGQPELGSWADRRCSSLLCGEHEALQSRRIPRRTGCMHPMHGVRDCNSLKIDKDKSRRIPRRTGCMDPMHVVRDCHSLKLDNDNVLQLFG